MLPETERPDPHPPAPAEREASARTLEDELARTRAELEAAQEQLRRTAAALAASQAQLRSLDGQTGMGPGTLRDDFLAVMAHELKNPLNLIQLNAELLLRLPEARGLAAVQRAADIIRRTVASQAQTIDDLHDLARLDSGGLPLRRCAVDWPAVVDAVACALGEDVRARGVALAVQRPDRPLLVDADPVRLEQIVWNLVANAVKFTPAGGRIALALARDGDCARLDVADTGRGIAADALPRVFDRARPAEPGALRSQGGLGIGLAVVHSLATLHGGRVEAASAGPGRGAQFSVWLPLWRDAAG